MLLPSCSLSACIQGVGESLLALLYYPEKQQLLAVTVGGSAIILASSISKATSTAAEWSVLMRVKLPGLSGGAKLQVRLSAGC